MSWRSARLVRNSGIRIRSQVKGAAMWARLGGVHVVGWVLSILSTAAVAKASQVHTRSSAKTSEVKVTTRFVGRAWCLSL